MSKRLSIRSLSAARSVFVGMCAVVLLAVPARAADPIFPTGSKLGLVPPAGMVQSRNFEGFEDAQKNAAILLSVLPAEAYDQLDKSMVPEAMQKQGIEVAKREPITLPAGNGFLLSGEQSSGSAHYRKSLLVAATGDVTALVTVQVPDQDAAYSDQAIRDSLATLAVRANVPDAERLSLLPFSVGDLGGFRIDDVLPGRALMLVEPATAKSAGTAQEASKDADQAASADNAKDAGKNTHATDLNARFLVAALQGGPNEAEDRGKFARVTFDEIAGIKDVRIQDAEPLRIDNQSGYQTLAKAKDQNDTDVMVVQWLRFGSGGYMQMVGIARADAWPDVFNRMRAVRDGVDPK